MQYNFFFNFIILVKPYTFTVQLNPSIKLDSAKSLNATLHKNKSIKMGKETKKLYIERVQRNEPLRGICKIDEKNKIK